jgi:CheY-like chemotaxis protein
VEVNSLFKVHSLTASSPASLAGSEKLTFVIADEFREGTKGLPIMKRILLVDDDVMARQVLMLLLEQHGYACDEAEHGAAALAWLEQGQQVDLIISDNDMPVMPGLEFLVRVKANPQLATVPFILYSGKITDEMQRQAHQAGAMAVVTKPYNFSEFIAIVIQALENSVKRGVARPYH